MIDTGSSAAIWDEVEHGSYSADLPLYAELAAGRGPVLDLGCGTGRVALTLARRGHEVWALDSKPELVANLRGRAEAEGVDVRAIEADARSFALETTFDLIVAPMQLVQLLEGAQGRAAMLRCVRSHLAADGLFAAALVDPPLIWGEADEGSLPDVVQRDGWVFSSRPLRVRPEGAALVVERLRQTVSREGELSEERHETRLDVVEPARLEVEAVDAGLAPVGRRPVPPTDDHVGSVVVLLEVAR
jgi:SAM-dependent methyltransferase